MKTLERCPHPHAFPAIECTGVRLTRARRAPVCLCSHLKAVHQHHRPGLDCGLCGCRYYETARSVRRRGVLGNVGVLIAKAVIGGYVLAFVAGGVLFAVVIVRGALALIG